MRRRKPSRDDILVFGDINVDIIGRVKAWPEPGAECLAPRLELHCGGVAANCALALRQWGIVPRLLGCVGKDEFGGFLLKTLEENGVNASRVQRTSAALTGLLYINVTPNGQRTFFGSRGANRCAGGMPKPPALFKGVSAASLMGYSFLDRGPERAAWQILRAVHARGGWVSLDVGMEPSQVIPRKIMQIARHVDILFVSSDEAAAMTGTRDARESFKRFQRAGARGVVIKLGKRGCLIFESGTLRQVPSFSVGMVDSTGAGDAFVAAFLQARLRGWPASEAALAANAAGAVAASVVGAGENSPKVKEIARLLRASRLKKRWDAVRLRVLARLATIPRM
jgi:ribokinase